MTSAKLTRNRSALIVVDVQENLLSAIYDWEAVLATIVKLVKCANILNIPVIVTEQYPKGLGSTHRHIRELLPKFEPYEKITFSCFGSPDFVMRLRQIGCETLLLAGIETHICVSQTALDALEKGYRVHVAADASGSRALFNKETGLAKLRQAGVVITSFEIALHEWLERADTQEFKAVLPLVK
ncbi:MAG: hydrolase [Negativicutes bacterium]|nr:hydrolase [Negativicutes bacterium]